MDSGNSGLAGGKCSPNVRVKYVAELEIWNPDQDRPVSDHFQKLLCRLPKLLVICSIL